MRRTHTIVSSSPDRSIRARVTTIVAITFVGLLAVTWTAQVLLSLKLTLLEIDAAQTGFANSFAQRAEERFRQLERTFSDSVASLDLSSDAKTTHIELQRLLRYEPKLVVVTYKSSDGTRQSTALRDQISEINLSVRDLFNVKFGQISLGEVDFDDPLGARVPFKYARASRWPGGTLHGRLSLAILNDLIAEFATESTSSVFVSFADGRVVAHQNSTLAARIGAATEVTPAESLWTKVAMSFISDSWVGRDRADRLHMVASSPISGSTMRVYFTRPLANAIARVIDFQIAALVTLLAAVAAAIFASRWVARSVTRPVVALKKAVKEAQSSMALVRPESVQNDEVGELYESFSDLLAEIGDANLNLKLRVMEQTQDLEAANCQLVAASRHKSEFLAHMSHELRTPLNAVIGFSDLLKAQYFGPLNQKQSEYVRDINASGQHLLSLINDILDLAKVEAGRMELMLSDAHVAALVESCVALVSERINRGEQTLTVDVAPDVSIWPLDERKIKQCLLNLLSNASKFTPVSGAIALRVWIENSALFLAVSDDGVGIAADDVPKLFSEFYQARSGAAGSTSTHVVQREGTGLGLALTKGFVELHGGTITVASVVGEGSKFTIRIPTAA